MGCGSLSIQKHFCVSARGSCTSMPGLVLEQGWTSLSSAETWRVTFPSLHKSQKLQIWTHCPQAEQHQTRTHGSKPCNPEVLGHWGCFLEVWWNSFAWRAMGWPGELGAQCRLLEPICMGWASPPCPGVSPQCLTSSRHPHPPGISMYLAVFSSLMNHCEHFSNWFSFQSSSSCSLPPAGGVAPKMWWVCFRAKEGTTYDLVAAAWLDTCNRHIEG